MKQLSQYDIWMMNPEQIKEHQLAIEKKVMKRIALFAGIKIVLGVGIALGARHLIKSLDDASEETEK